MSEVWLQDPKRVVRRVVGKAHGPGQFAHRGASLQSRLNGGHEVGVPNLRLGMDMPKSTTDRLLVPLGAETADLLDLLAVRRDLAFGDVAQQRVFRPTHFMAVHADDLMLARCERARVTLGGAIEDRPEVAALGQFDIGSPAASISPTMALMRASISSVSDSMK